MTKPVQQIMSKKVVTIGLADSVRTAYQIMVDHHFRHLPVVDASGTIIGILSDRDLQRAMKPKKSSLDVDSEIEFDSKHRVEDFMSWPVRTVSIDARVYDLTETMLNEKISALLVLGEHERAKGIVTTDDLLKFLLQLLAKDPGTLQKTLGSVFEEFSYGGYPA